MIFHIEVTTKLTIAKVWPLDMIWGHVNEISTKLSFWGLGVDVHGFGVRQAFPHNMWRYWQLMVGLVNFPMQKYIILDAFWNSYDVIRRG